MLPWRYWRSWRHRCLGRVRSCSQWWWWSAISDLWRDGMRHCRRSVDTHVLLWHRTKHGIHVAIRQCRVFGGAGRFFCVLWSEIAAVCSNKRLIRCIHCLPVVEGFRSYHSIGSQVWPWHLVTGQDRVRFPVFLFGQPAPPENRLLEPKVLRSRRAATRSGHAAHRFSAWPSQIQASRQRAP